mmetsp:Transcript_80898/g.152921  ORF Transcript_80898/g.152921 Transcript_80898/m.152921 type:complete len:252 (+) Transcript_80898:33-788(+)
MLRPIVLFSGAVCVASWSGSVLPCKLSPRTSITMQVTEVAPTSVADNPMFLDEEAELAKAAFPISAPDLILKAKEYLANGQGVDAPDMLAEDFEFMGPVVGPLTKDAYLKAVGGFKLPDAFPDFSPAFHHFRVDPFEGDRVWFTSRATGTDTGSGFLGNKPTGKSFETPPQTCSVKFNAEGKVVRYTIGYVNDRALGNTGGLGGIFGPAYALGNGLPFREAQPYKPSFRYKFFQQVGAFVTWLQDRQKKKD